MSVTLILSRSSAAYESGIVPTEVPDTFNVGSFAYVEMTYNVLRVGIDGDHDRNVACFEDGAWWSYDDAYPFTDFQIIASDES